MNSEEQRGYTAALEAIKRSGNTAKAAKHHLKVSNCDLKPDSFTRGWQRACRALLAALTPQKQ